MNFLTGSTGLVGMRLALDLLQRGEPVRALFRSGSNLKLVEEVFSFYDQENGHKLFDQIEWVEGDVLDLSALRPYLNGVKKIFHSAAVVSYDLRDSDLMQRVNVQGTANLVNLALEVGVEKFAHVSSVSALSVPENGDCMDESNYWIAGKEFTPYGLSKYLAEQEVWRGIEEGLQAVIVNPCMVLGAGKTGKSSAQIFKMLGRKWPAYPPGTAGYVDVRDVSRSLVELAFSDITAQRYVLVGENASYRDLLHKGMPLFGLTPPEKKMSPFVIKMLWRAAYLGSLITGKRPTFSRQIAQNVMNKRCYNPAKIKETLGITFYDLSQSLPYFAPFYLKAWD